MSTPTLNVPAANRAAPAEPEGSMDLRSKGLLPAIGVGGAVYLITGIVSLGTIAMVGIGAGVGYGVGSWLRDKYEQKQAEKNPQGGQQLPPEFQVSLMQWQVFLQSRSGGSQLTPPQVQQLFMEFEQIEPIHARNVRSIQSAVDSSQGGRPVQVVATAAAEV